MYKFAGTHKPTSTHLAALPYPAYIHTHLLVHTYLPTYLPGAGHNAGAKRVEGGRHIAPQADALACDVLAHTCRSSVGAFASGMV